MAGGWQRDSGCCVGTYVETPTENAGAEATRHERIIKSLAEGSSHSVAEVKALFVREYARLADGAKIRVHLLTLATSNVRSQLRRAS
jgi:hypothetical protein